MIYGIIYNLNLQQNPFIMRIPIIMFLIQILSYLHPVQAQTDNYRQGDEINISDSITDDLYAAGREINITAEVNGDAVLAGGVIHVEKKIESDLTAVGGNLFITGYIGDDLRLAGGKIVLNDTVADDVFITGGRITVSKGAYVGGNLVCAGGRIFLEGEVGGDVNISGGEVEISGTVNGNLSVKSGELKYSGTVNGITKIASREIELEEGAVFNNDVTYWSKKEDIGFEDQITSGTLTYDKSLKSGFGWDWRYFGIGMVGYWFVTILGSLLLMLILIAFFPKWLEKASAVIDSNPVKALGTGVLYYILMPLVSLILIIIIIGIPFGLLFLMIFIISIIYSIAITSVVFSGYIIKIRNKPAGKGIHFIIAFGLYIALRLVFNIPVIGWIICTILSAFAFGALIRKIKSRNSIAIPEGAD